MLVEPLSAPTGLLPVLARHRNLLRSLIERELKARYRGSALGFLWSLANPLLLLGVFSLVFGRILGPRGGESEAHPYALFLITGLFPWIWASTSLLEGTVSLTANAALVRKAAFPVPVMPVVVTGANLIHFLLALPILFGALGVGRAMGFDVLSSPWVAAVPLVILLELLMLSGAALGLAVLHVHFKDVRDLLNNLLQLFFFLAPIIYPMSLIEWPAVARLIRLNPFTPFTLAYQDLLFFGRAPSVSVWLQMVILALVAWIVGSWLASRLGESVAEAV